MKIVVLDGYTLNPGDNPWDELEKAGELEVYDRTTESEIIHRARDAEILLTNKTPLTQETIAALPRLKFIAVLATGYNVVDVRAAKEKGIPVANVPTYGTGSVAQHTIALLLELCHHVGEHDASVRAGDWNCQPDFCYWKAAPLELEGLTLGIIGFGRIGQRVASIAHGFGMRIVYLQKDRTRPGPVFAQGVPLERLLKEADVISLHCAQTAENKEFVNRDFLSAMKPGSFLINTARGALIDENDLAAALHTGRLGGAALDVLCNEPPPRDHPLIGAPRCLITPHMAWTSLRARTKLLQTTVSNVQAFLAGRPINVVNGV